MHEHLESKAMPAEHTSVTDRIRYLISATRHNQSSFAKAIGVDAASVSRILGSDRRPSEAFLNRIVVNLGVSKQWLTEGTDVPFPRNPHSDASARQGAPVYDIDVTAGSTPLSRMFTHERHHGSRLPARHRPRPTHCARERRLHDAQAAPRLLRVYPTDKPRRPLYRGAEYTWWCSPTTVL